MHQLRFVSHLWRRRGNDPRALHRAAGDPYRATHACSGQLGSDIDRGRGGGAQKGTCRARSGHDTGQRAGLDSGPQGATQAGIEAERRRLQVITEQRRKGRRIAGQR